jgi:hypothetical protein
LTGSSFGFSASGVPDRSEGRHEELGAWSLSIVMTRHFQIHPDRDAFLCTFGLHG